MRANWMLIICAGGLTGCSDGSESLETTEGGETIPAIELILEGKLVGAECAWACPLMLIDVDNGTEAVLTEDAADFAAWSPSGEQVAYVAGGRVMVMNIDGSQATEIGADALHPAWSPDESAVLMTQYGQASEELVMVTLDDGESTVLASQGNRGSWSPDGASIAYTVPGDGMLGFMEQDIYVVDIVSGESTFLTPGFGPLWSPDGQSIAFGRNDPERVTDESSESHFGPGMGAGIDVYVWDLASATEEAVYLSDLSLAMWYMGGLESIQDWIDDSRVLLVTDVTSRLGDDGYEIISHTTLLLDTATGDFSDEVTELVNPSWHR